eukprot:CAMPEP_0203904600 /NCGR_PEP_ID=MMETSP0359-20131031/46403_1 /ASSEMBLY_ACC=CAM_ASM_000338 /TAXON_ID=268821 /ORGANISM="Scrippsiella Hangoei, Strain SHTV-5" /LENGTH=408 /DNA_ID=CAMNT_0050828881 /DNA_START=67 /DNA_END=1293 /DNA_ORIENTATION=+
MADGATTPASNTKGFTIKNTFVEVDDPLEEENFEADMDGMFRMRQMSCPAFVFGRQLSRQVTDLEFVQEEPEHAVRADIISSGTGEIGSNGSGDEPETEIEPHQAALTAAGLYAALNADAQPFFLPQANMAMWSPINDAGTLCDGHSFMMPSAPDGNSQACGTIDPMQFASVAVVPDICDLDIAPEWGDTITVMMRNLPNRYSQQMLKDEITNVGFSGSFDFLYLPIDPETNANKGYAFINFVDSMTAWRFKVAFEGKQMSRFNSGKYVSVSPAALQGLEANFAHYSTARCSRGDPAARPLFLREPASVMRRGGPATGASVQRRGGQRRKGASRSLVDVAVAQKSIEQQHMHPAMQLPMGLGLGSCGLGAAQAGAPAHSFCPYCGGAVQATYSFCQFCGASQAGISQK